jgi:putative component of membrane protein insertase Oxa1/YidC/SpoIIIJ protein YidD
MQKLLRKNNFLPKQNLMFKKTQRYFLKLFPNIKYHTGKKLFAALFFLSGYCAIAQPASDIAIILGKKETNSNIKRSPTFGFSQSKKWYVKYNPLTLSAASLLYAYQRYLSPQFSATCGFSPSCSGMSKLLISNFGLIKGTFCTADRLTRCNKISFADVDPTEINPMDGKIYEDISRYK